MKTKEKARISKRKQTKGRTNGNGIAKNLNGLYTKNEPFLLIHFRLVFLMLRHFILLYDFTLPRFPKHDKTVESHETGVDLVLFSLALSTSPHPLCVHPFCLLTEALSRYPWRDQTLLVDITLFLDVSVFNICLCAYSEWGTRFFLCLLLGFSRTLNGKRHSNGGEAVLYLLFDLLYQYWWWESSCRIFYIARIVRQWENGGAIWNENSATEWNLRNGP